MQQPTNLESSRKGIVQHQRLSEMCCLAADIPKCLQNCCSFYRKVNNLSTLLPTELDNRQTINHFSSVLWQLSIPRKEQFSGSVPGIAGRAYGLDIKHRCSLTLIASYQTNYTIYSNGSTSEGKKTRAEQQLLLEDPQSSLKWLTPSEPKTEDSPALTSKKKLPWNQV